MEFKSNTFQIFLQLESYQHTTFQWHIRGISYTFQNDSTCSSRFICNLTKLNPNVGLNLHFKMQYTPFKWNCLTHQDLYIKFQPSIMCLRIAFILIATSCFVCRVEVEPEPEAAPFVEDPEIEPRQQGKQTPIDHVDKIPLPSHLSHMHCIG